VSTPDLSAEGASSEDRAEQQTPVVRGADGDAEVPFEAVGADVAEQAASAGPPEPPVDADLPLEADAADAAEQAAVVELDEDDHR
jgi:hypothetical protein